MHLQFKVKMTKEKAELNPRSGESSSLRRQMGKVVSSRSDYFIFTLLMEHLLGTRRWAGNWVTTVNGYSAMFLVFTSEVLRFTVLLPEKLTHSLVIKQNITLVRHLEIIAIFFN